MIVLVPVDDDGEDGAPIQFDQPYIQVGRGPHNDLILDEDDQAASYEHALITVVQGRAVVVCEPTANPTYIDGADVGSAPEEERELRPGHILSFGKGRSIFRVQEIGEAVAAADSPRRQVRVRLPAAKSKPADEPLIEIDPPERDRPTEPQDPSVCPVSFQVFRGEQLVREETFRQPLIRIGRMRSSHLLLDDKSVSRTHAVVEVTAEGAVLLIDLDSSGGTAVNGARVKKAILKSGDRLDFGEARVIVSFDKVVARAPATPVVARAPATPPVPAVSAKRKQRRSTSPPPAPSDEDIGPTHTQLLWPATGQASVSPRLVVRCAGVEREEHVLAKRHTSIGRLPENDIQLDDGAVSGKHAMVVAEAGLFLIVDQRSTNGTYLNGERCAGDSLKDGDVIQIGRYELVFVGAHPAQAGKPPKTEVLSPEAARAMFAKIGGRRGRKT